MRRWRWLAMAVALCAGSCATGPRSPEAFTDAWAHEVDGARREQELRQPRKGIPLLGTDDNAPAAVVPDEEGNPQLQLGKGRGVRTEVKVGGETSVRMKYGWGWTWRRPTR